MWGKETCKQMSEIILCKCPICGAEVRITAEARKYTSPICEIICNECDSTGKLTNIGSLDGRFNIGNMKKKHK